MLEKEGHTRPEKTL